MNELVYQYLKKDDSSLAEHHAHEVFRYLVGYSGHVYNCEKTTSWFKQERIRSPYMKLYLIVSIKKEKDCACPVLGVG